MARGDDEYHPQMRSSLFKTTAAWARRFALVLVSLWACTALVVFGVLLPMWYFAEWLTK